MLDETTKWLALLCFKYMHFFTQAKEMSKHNLTLTIIDLEKVVLFPRGYNPAFNRSSIYDIKI